MRAVRAFRAREGLFRLIPPKPNRFGLALPPKLNIYEIEKLASIGSVVGDDLFHCSLFHALVDKKSRATEFRLYLRVCRFRTQKLVWAGPTYALKDQP